MHYKLGQACVTNWAAVFYYKLGQTLLQIGAASLSQDRGRCCYKLEQYYKLEQPLLQNMAAITTWGKNYSKLGQVLQIWAVITNLDITPSMSTV